MGKTIGRFKYKLTAPRKGDMPFNAIVRLGLKTWSSDEKGWPMVSPDLMTEGEIDAHVKACKEDLDHVGRLAKRALRRANERTHAEMAARKRNPN